MMRRGGVVVSNCSGSAWTRLYTVSKRLLTVYGAQHLLGPLVVCPTILSFAIPQIYDRFVPGQMSILFVGFADGETQFCQAAWSAIVQFGAWKFWNNLHSQCPLHSGILMSATGLWGSGVFRFLIVRQLSKMIWTCRTKANMFPCVPCRLIILLEPNNVV